MENPSSLIALTAYARANAVRAALSPALTVFLLQEIGPREGEELRDKAAGSGVAMDPG